MSGPDAEHELRTFTEEVAPLVRDAVGAARGGMSPVRTAGGATAGEVTAGGAAADGNVPAVPEASGHIDLWSADPLGEATRPHIPKPPSAVARPGGTGSRLIGIHAHLRQEMRQIIDAVSQVAAGRQDAATARSMINSLTLRQNYWLA
ncbi:hypothetical protein ACWGDX_09355 [Streptomyces sp. NPDC055025]